ncbi:hypothetical protein ANCDUO_19222, partial [Ancylostoma duodenale]
RHALRSAPAKPYSFPKWRSTDALSASLVASNSVDVPQDSVIPERRLQKMRETDRKAVLQKVSFSLGECPGDKVVHRLGTSNCRL